jgi:hypothetical protein
MIMVISACAELKPKARRAIVHFRAKRGIVERVGGAVRRREGWGYEALDDGSLRGPKCREGRAARGRDVAAEAELAVVDVIGGGTGGAVGAQRLLDVEIGGVLVLVPLGFDAEELGRLVLRASS